MLTPLFISESLTLPASEMSWEAVRSSGPGGQNVNKVASKVVLRFDLAASLSLSPEVKERVLRLAGSRVDGTGTLVLSSQLTRDQHRNLEDARRRLAELIRKALVRPLIRRPTRPGPAAVERRVTAKKRRGMLKRKRNSDEAD